MKNPFKKVYTAYIYMKSGSVIVLDKVSEIDFTHDENSITSMTLLQSNKAINTLRVPSISLRQIEAIVKHKPHWTLFY